MKVSLLLSLLILAVGGVRGERYEAMEMSPEDLVVIEKEAPGAEARKVRISFDAAEEFVLRHSNGWSQRDLPIRGKSKSFTLVTAVSPEGGPIKSLHFWIKGDGGAVYSYFAIDAEKAVVTTTGMKNGIFKMAGFSRANLDKPEYEIEVRPARPF